jgi:hypothetical protein
MPLVVSEASMDLVATKLASGGSAQAYSHPNAAATTQFEVESGAGSDPVLYGSIYLLISGDEAGSSVDSWGTPSVVCAGSNLMASSMGLDIYVAGVLQTANGPVYVGDWYIGDVNALYATEEDTSDGNVHPLIVTTEYEAWATAYSPNAESHWFVYNEASFVVQER